MTVRARSLLHSAPRDCICDSKTPAISLQSIAVSRSVALFLFFYWTGASCIPAIFVRSLDLSSNTIGDEGLQALAQSISSPAAGDSLPLSDLALWVRSTSFCWLSPPAHFPVSVSVDFWAPTRPSLSVV